MKTLHELMPELDLMDEEQFTRQEQTVPIETAVSIAKEKRVMIHPEDLDIDSGWAFWDGERFRVAPWMEIHENADVRPTFTIEEAALPWIIEWENCDEADSPIYAEREGNAKWIRDQERKKQERENTLARFAKEGVTMIPGGLAAKPPEPMTVKRRKKKDTLIEP